MTYQNYEDRNNDLLKGDNPKDWIFLLLFVLLVAAFILNSSCKSPYEAQKHRILTEKQYRQNGKKAYAKFSRECTPYRPKNFRRK